LFVIFYTKFLPQCLRFQLLTDKTFQILFYLVISFPVACAPLPAFLSRKLTGIRTTATMARHESNYLCPSVSIDRTAQQLAANAAPGVAELAAGG
jgi:hypothetical protein